MTDVELRRRGGSSAGPPRVMFYDYPSIRSGRLVMHHASTAGWCLLPVNETAPEAVCVPIAEHSLPTGPVDVLADHLVERSRRPRAKQPFELERYEPRDLVDGVLDIWRDASDHQSSMRQAAKHPAFALLAKAPSIAIELIVSRLRESPNPLWVWALGELTGEDPASGTDSLGEAASAWVAWADRRGLG